MSGEALTPEQIALLRSLPTEPIPTDEIQPLFDLKLATGFARIPGEGQIPGVHWRAALTETGKVLLATLDAANQNNEPSNAGDGAAASHEYPLFDLSRALEIVERVKAFVGGDIDAELASTPVVLADLDNIAFCLKLATPQNGEGDA